MRDDERGQSVQIGAVLLFGVLVVALAGYQAFVVPQQNERVEFAHSQTVGDQLSDLRDAVVSVPGASTTRSVSIRLGTRYPPRLVALNPGPPTGTVRTRGTGDPAVSLSVANAAAAGETGDVWNGTARTYPTGWLRYSANYNVYGGAPTTYYGSSVLFDEFPSGTVPATGQTLVDGDRVTLVALNGSLSVTRTDTASVDVRPVSASTTPVAVENATTDENVTVRVPTRLSLETWEELLDGEFVDQGGHVVRDDLRTEPLGGYPDARTLVIELERGVTYDLRAAKAGVGRRVTDEPAAYMIDVDGNGSAVREGGSRQLTVEVRDAYDNPVSGVEVRAGAESGTVASDAVTTGANGRAAFRYEAPEVTDGLGATPEVEDSIRFSYEVDPATAAIDPSEPEHVEMTVWVQNLAGNGQGGGNSSGDGQGGGNGQANSG